MVRLHTLFHIRARILFVCGALLFLCLFGKSGFATWNTSPAINNPVVTAQAEQTNFTMTTDGKGGAIIAWQDARGADFDIYAQRIDAWGNSKWQANGVPICTAADQQSNPIVVSDHNGGAYIVWIDARNLSSSSTPLDTAIYIQHVDSNGTGTFGVNGAPAWKKFQTISDHFTAISDGIGGIYIAWEDNDTCLTLKDTEVCAYMWNGNCLYWTSEIICDESILPSSVPRILMQHVDINDKMFTPDSVAVVTCDTSTHKFPQTFPNLVPDGSGGVFVVWEDLQQNETQILYQHFDSKGAMLLPSAGSTVCKEPHLKNNLTAVSDNNGGFVAAWEDSRNAVTTGTDIYAQHVLDVGMLAWTSAGIPVVQHAGEQRVPELVCDSAGDAYVSWQDYRNGYSVPDYYGADLYCQLLNAADGSPRWNRERRSHRRRTAGSNPTSHDTR